jgi:membrane-associated phospholipid phosphatase
VEAPTTPQLEDEEVAPTPPRCANGSPVASPATPLARLNPIAAIGRFLPKGWPDFLLQLAIFATFDIAYELSRSLATGKRSVAFAHARDIVRWERDLGIFHELGVQHWAQTAPGIVGSIASWTYFNCQFTISIAFLLWVYARRNDSYYFIRNVVIAADFIGVIGYIGFPAAPPRMLSSLGFVDTLAATYKNTAVASLANPYAAMPSLHTAYALLIGTCGVLLTRRLWAKALWSLYPALVVFSIVATANHYFLDAIAGALTISLAFLLALLLRYAMRRVKHVPIGQADGLTIAPAAGD